MVSGIGAYQQTVSLQQVSQTSTRENQQQPVELRERDRSREDSQVSRTRDAALTRTNGDEQTRQQQRLNDLENMPTQAGGKDAAMRRGSLLDVTV